MAAGRAMCLAVCMPALLGAIVQDGLTVVDPGVCVVTCRLKVGRLVFRTVIVSAGAPRVCASGEVAGLRMDVAQVSQLVQLRSAATCTDQRRSSHLPRPSGFEFLCIVYDNSGIAVEAMGTAVGQ